MKQKIKNLSKLMIILCSLPLWTNCSTEEIPEKELVGQLIDIKEAKSWFEYYNSATKKYSIFEKQSYNWEKAKIEKLENGTEAIIVPASNTYANNQYMGKRILYLYPSEDKKSFNTTLYDVITKRSNSNDFSNFSGYIIAWNIETGFASGLKFENNKSLNSIIVEDFLKQDYKPQNVTRKEAPLPIIHLDEVTIDGGGGSNTSINVKDFSIGGIMNNDSGTSSGGYIGYPQGGGGGSSSGKGTSSIKSKAEFIAVIESTNANAVNINFVQKGNTITATATIGLVPFANIALEIPQTKVGNKYVVNNVVTNLVGVTAGLSWSQTTYSQTISGNTTTVIFNGITTIVMPIEGLGAIYSYQMSYSIKIDNTNGKIISGTRLK